MAKSGLTKIRKWTISGGLFKKKPTSGGLFLRKGSFQVGCENPVATLWITTSNISSALCRWMPLLDLEDDGSLNISDYSRETLKYQVMSENEFIDIQALHLAE